MTTSFFDFITRWRYLVILVMLTLIVGAASGVRLLQFEADYRIYFSEENPQLTAFEKLQDSYTNNDNVLFVLAPKDGQVFTPKILAAVEKLTNDAWQVPYSVRVDSITNFQHTYAEGDHLIVNNLVRDVEHLTAENLTRIREIALHEPLLLNRLISKKADVTGVNVNILLPGKNQQLEALEVADFARKIVDNIQMEYPDLDIYLTGMIMMNNAFPEASKQDMSTLMPIMFFIVIVTIGLLLGAITGTIITVLVIVFSILSAMGLAGWLGIVLSPPSAMAPNIILTLAVADCVHILVTFSHGLKTGMEKRAALIESLRVNFLPVFLTSLTTAIGFLSMNFSDAPPFHDLGNITAMGVGIAFVLSVTFLPAALMILPVRIKGGKNTTWLDSIITQIAEMVIHKQKILFWGIMVVIVGIVVFIPRNELNDEFVKYFDKTVDFRQATDFTTENLTGVDYISYSLDSGKPDGIHEPAFLTKIEKFANWYREQPEVLHVSVITDTLKRLNKNIHGDEPSWYKLPESREMASQYLLLYEMSLPYGLDLNNQNNIDKSATRLTATLKSISSNQILSLERRAQKWLENNAPTLQTDGSSPTIMFAHIGQRNIKSMLWGTSVALVLISFLLMFALGSIKIGLISLIPNFVTVSITFGLWGIFVGEVGLAVSVIAAITLGIVVDDTIHFLSKYLHARRKEGKNAQDAIRYAFATVGTAIWISSVALIIGFLVLAFSSFKVNADLGLLTAITIFIAFLANFFFLPPLLLKLEKEKT
jgi:predicted RND superfamily exporter protein